MYRKALVALTVLALGVGATQAEVYNYDPDGVPPPPVLGAGWTYDQIDSAFVNSIDSPYVYNNLAAPAIFRITDYHVVGELYYVYDFGGLILTTEFNGAQAPLAGTVGDPFGKAGWESAAYSHGEVLLAAGSHHLTVQGDGPNTFPAGLYTRLDPAPIPEPSTLIILSVLGATGILVWRRRSR